MIKVVILILTTWNCNTGQMLTQSEYDDSLLPTYSVEGKVDRIERCRKSGVSAAKKLTRQFEKTGLDNVSTNVDCHWGAIPGNKI